MSDQVGRVVQNWTCNQCKCRWKATFLVNSKPEVLAVWHETPLGKVDGKPECCPVCGSNDWHILGVEQIDVAGNYLAIWDEVPA